jgi:hypothetical protein
VQRPPGGTILGVGVTSEKGQYEDFEKEAQRALVKDQAFRSTSGR